MIRIVLALCLAMPLNACANACALLADMAIVARALAEDGIGEAQSARVMARIYIGVRPGVLEQVASAAASVSLAPAVYSQRVQQACEAVRRGDKEV